MTLSYLQELAPIGLFDSGIGGTTLMRHLIHEMPQESLIYLADNARLPYGDRSIDELIAISIENSLFLQELGCKMIVAACNTTSSIALEALSIELSIPVVGVIETAAIAAVNQTQNGHIGVIGTSRTIESKSYEKEIKRHSLKATVTSFACPTIVPFIENNSQDALLADITPIIQSLMDTPVDTLILGCTHFPLIRSQIESLIQREIQIIDPSQTTIEQIKSILETKQITAPHTSAGSYRFFTSGPSSPFQEMASAILDRQIPVIFPQHITEALQS